MTVGNYGAAVMIIKTRVFELCTGRYQSLSELAQIMGLSVSQIYRVRDGSRSINHKFIVGAKKAFPDYGLDELFYLDNELSQGNNVETFVIKRYNHVVEQFASLDLVEAGRQTATRS